MTKLQNLREYIFHSLQQNTGIIPKQTLQALNTYPDSICRDLTRYLKKKVMEDVSIINRFVSILNYKIENKIPFHYAFPIVNNDEKQTFLIVAQRTRYTKPFDWKIKNQPTVTELYLIIQEYVIEELFFRESQTGEEHTFIDVYSLQQKNIFLFQFSLLFEYIMERNNISQMDIKTNKKLAVISLDNDFHYIQHRSNKNFVKLYQSVSNFSLNNIRSLDFFNLYKKEEENYEDRELPYSRFGSKIPDPYLRFLRSIPFDAWVHLEGTLWFDDFGHTTAIKEYRKRFTRENVESFEKLTNKITDKKWLLLQ